MKLAFFAVFRGHFGKMLGFGRGKFACVNQDLQKVVLAFRIGALPLVKQIGHTVNLVQKNFVGERRKRYILDKVLVKQFFQPFGRDIPFLEDIAEHAQHFRPVGPLAKRRGGAVLDREELFQFHQIDIQLVIGHSAVPVEPHMVQVGVLFSQELVFGQDREHVDMRQPVGLRLLDRAGNHPRRIVDEPVNKELVVALLDLDKDGVARLRRAVDVDTNCSPGRVQTTVAFLKGGPARSLSLPKGRHALFYGPAAFRSLSLPKGAAPLTKPSKANAVTTVLARVGMAEPQRVSPKPSLAPLAVIPARHHVIPAQAGISLLVPRVSALTRPLGVKSGRSHLVSPRSRQHDSLRRVAYGSRGHDRCRETLEEAC